MILIVFSLALSLGEGLELRISLNLVNYGCDDAECPAIAGVDGGSDKIGSTLSLEFFGRGFL